MSLENRILQAVLDLLARQQEVTVSSIARTIGISRQNLQYYIRKSQLFTDVEIIK